MVLGRFRDAVSDVAETIRRTFQNPPCRTVATEFGRPGTAPIGLLETTCIPVDYQFEPGIRIQDLRFCAVLHGEPMSFEARLRREDAWAAWAAGAKVCEMAVFRVGNCSRLAVPSLPRSVPVRGVNLPPFRITSRFIREVIAAPAIRHLSPGFSPPRVSRGLEAVLGLPLAIGGEDLLKLPKALSMRYTFQLVKATGENIRNLEVLGVYPVPVKGVTALRHDAGTGRILVNLGPEAIGAHRGRFILARKKDDHSFVSCFVEE
jgi:hypothetical protein